MRLGDGGEERERESERETKRERCISWTWLTGGSNEGQGSKMSLLGLQGSTGKLNDPHLSMH